MGLDLCSYLFCVFWARLASVSHRSAISTKNDLCAKVWAASANRMHSAALLRHWSKLGNCASISILCYLAMSKFGTREGRARVARSGILWRPFGMGRAARRADTHRMRDAMALASKHNSIRSVIAPADGTRTAIAGKRRLRYVCVFWQLSDKLVLVRIDHMGFGRQGAMAGRKIKR